MTGTSQNRGRGRAPVVGVDAGGTWVRVLATCDGRTVLRTTAPAKSISDLGAFLRTTLAPLGRPSSILIASRGVWTPSERHRLARPLQSFAGRVDVISDAQAALIGALGDVPGVLLLAGTGSIALARDARGRWARAGGLGPLLGDEGSAFWLGREWLRATSEREDFTPARRLIRAPDAVARIAALAPRVIARARHGDPRARRIVRDGQSHLARLVVSAARRRGLRQPITVSWAGSVIANEWFRNGVVRALRRAGVRAHWSRPETDALTAAARLAASHSCPS